MGALVVVAALILPIGFHVFIGSRLDDRLTDRLTQDVGEEGVGCVYIAVWFAAVFAMLWAARLTGVGVAAVLAFGFATLAVRLIQWLNGENAEIE